MSTRGIINLGVAVGIAAILFYLGEENTTLVLLAIAGLVYLYFFGVGGIKQFA